MGAKHGLSPNTDFIILPKGLPKKSEIPLFTVNDDTAINGNREGISTFMHISIPENAPSAHSFEKIKSIMHTITIASESSATVNLRKFALINIAITINIYVTLCIKIIIKL